MPQPNHPKRAGQIIPAQPVITARQSISGRLFDGPTPQTSASSPLPTLRSALRLYLLVVLATAALVVGLVTAVDVTFLRFLAAIVVFNGFTFLALLVTRTRPAPLTGQPLSPLMLGVALLAGIALWTPGTWWLLVTSQTLGAAFGNLPPPIGSSVTLIGKAVVFGLIIPLSEGWLFFGYILSAARGVGVWRGVWLTALLFGLFGMFADQFGMSAIPAYFLLGLLGGTLVVWSGSMWSGIAVLSAFELADPLGLSQLLSSFLSNQAQDLLSFRWLIAVAMFAFFTFALTRIARSFHSRQTDVVPAPPGSAWWLPLLVVVVLVVLIGRAEIQTRILNAVQVAPAQSNPGAQTAPPVAPLISPTPTFDVRLLPDFPTPTPASAAP